VHPRVNKVDVDMVLGLTIRKVSWKSPLREPVDLYAQRKSASGIKTERGVSIYPD